MAIAKLDWVCRGCGSRLRKPRWIDLVLLGVTVIAFIAFILFSLLFYAFLFEQVLGSNSGWAVFACVLLTIGIGFAMYAYAYPYISFHRLKEARPHCVKCMYPVEPGAQACPECGEIVPWNQDLPKAWTRVRFGDAKCNRCLTTVPRNAKYEKGGEWVCKGCGSTLIQPPHLYAIGNSIQAVVMFLALVVGGITLAVAMNEFFPAIHGLIAFVGGAALGLFLVMAAHWVIFPYVSPYIVKDARVHCGECGIAVPQGLSHCASCTRPVRYPKLAEPNIEQA
jgi:predicted nucleic acid-binding Zn ribbon protein